MSKLVEQIEEALENRNASWERVWFTANGDLQVRCRNQVEALQLVRALKRRERLTMRRFLAITRLFNAMRDDAERLALHGRASSLGAVREKYRRKLERMLNR